MDGNALSNITIMGLTSAPASTEVTLNGKGVRKGFYNATSQTFFIGDLDSATSSGAWAENWTLRYGAESGCYDLRGVAVP
jgi:alpha-glucosidase